MKKEETGTKNKLADLSLNILIITLNLIGLSTLRMAQWMKNAIYTMSSKKWKREHFPSHSMKPTLL